MPREAEPSQNEKAFVLKALQENIRTDGRALDAFRPFTLAFGDEYGIADVSLGKTRVRAHISAEVTTPFPDRKFDGIFTISTELSPMASASFEPGRPTDLEILLSRLLEKTLRRSSAVDTESLCLIAGQKVWSIRADVHVLSHDGNLIDAACMAVVAGLRHFRKPDVEVHGEEVTVFSAAEREPVPLSILHYPFCVTFSFFEGDGVWVVDAGRGEEAVRVGSCTVSMNRHGEVCQIAKLGGEVVDAVELLHCVGVAGVKVKDMSALLQKRLDEDAVWRNKGIAELSAENERIVG